MAYQYNNVILEDEYNTFVSGNAAFGVSDNDVANLNTVWGVVTVTKGMGKLMYLIKFPMDKK